MEKKQSPWNELDYYKEGQPIYGRDEDIRKISNSICQNLQTTLYGQSGIGKSSLLFAGIFPVLRKEEYFPVFIRLGLASEEESYVDFVINTIKDDAKRSDNAIGKEVIELKTLKKCNDTQPNLSDTERLWNFFCYTEFVNKNDEPFIPVLVFDQFEEILNNQDTYPKAKQFLLDIYTLLDDTRIQPEDGVSYSNYRIVFSLREDYLYCLEDIIDIHNLTELRFNRFRVRALSHTQAKEVIIRTADGEIENGLEQEICEKIIAESQNYMGDVNTLMLSLVCSTCYLNSTDGIIRLKALDNNEDYLYYYYESKLGVVSIKTKQYLENVLVTNDGRRDSIDIKTATDSGKILQEEIDLLVSNRIVRVLSSSEGGKRMEFIHDKITSIINTRKQTSWHCLKSVFLNLFNLNSRANIKEYKISEISFLIGLCIFYISFIIGLSIDSDRLIAISYYPLIISSYIFIATTIRRSHDRNISGWDGLFDYQKNRIKPSAQQIYSAGSSAKIAARRIHPFNTMSREEYVASHKFFFFYVFWIVLLLIPSFALSVNNIIFLEYLIAYSIICIVGFPLNFVFYRLPAMGLSPWLGILPLVPWLYGFHKKSNEQFYELNIGKATKNVFVLYILLIIAFVSFFIYYDERKEEKYEPEEAENVITSWDLNEMAYEHADAGDYEGAHAYIDAAIEQDPNDANLYDSKGDFYMRQDSVERAMEMWKKVMELNPDFLKYYPNGTELSNELKKRKLIE